MTLNTFVNGSIIWQFQIFIIMESIHSWCDDIKINVSWPTDLYRWAMMIRAKNSIIKTDLMILFACFNQMWECIEVHWWKQWYFNFWQIKVNYLFLLKGIIHCFIQILGHFDWKMWRWSPTLFLIKKIRSAS